MFSILDEGGKLCDGITRREMMRIGGLGLLGAAGLSPAGVTPANLSLPDLLSAQALAGPAGDSMFGRAKNVIYLWLQGGPPQHETWDPKPNAPAEIRGEYSPINTNVPGIQFCELLPRCSTIADKLAVVRSLTTRNNIHSASGYHVLTGYRYRGPNARQITPNDWPYFGSVVRQLMPSASMPAYTSVWLPNVMRLNENVKPAGQTAGFMGRRWEPERIYWDGGNAQIENFSLHEDVPALRLQSRRRLLEQVDRHLAGIESTGVLNTYSRQRQDAFSILTTGRARQAFDIEQEPARTRERYGNTKWGQCVLLARRLVEAGVRLVHVNWVREPGDSAVDNPMWDTHALNADRLQDALCPIFDIGFTALIEDLDRRGLLDETLVVAIAEFGRTPRINGSAGRDHWGNVFSFVMAGAGIRSAQVYGSSDRIGGEPNESAVTPGDVTATIFHLLGIPHHASFRDPSNRPHHITEGEPIAAILGSTPATSERRASAGNPALVPPYNDEKLLNVAFSDNTPLIAAGQQSRAKGWRAAPISPAGFGVRILASHQASLGFDNTGATPLQIQQGSKALLAQEIRNARAGRYRFIIRAAATAASAADFALFRDNFTCRLILFRFATREKDPRQVQQLAVHDFQPTYQDGEIRWQNIMLDRLLDSPRPGANFSIGLGLGVAIVVEKTSPGTLAVQPPHRADLRIDSVELIFGGRQINEDVQV